MKINWPVVLLVSSLLTLTAVAFDAQRQNHRHRITAHALLGDYADFAVYNYGSRLKGALIHMAMLAVEPAHSKRAGEAFKALGLEYRDHKCDCANNVIEATDFFHYSSNDGLRGEHDNVVAAADLIVRAVTEDAGAAAEMSQYTMRSAPDGSSLIAMHLPHTSDEHAMAYGAHIAPDDLGRYLRDHVSRTNLLPASLTRGTPIDSLLDLAVFLPGRAQPVFSTASDDRWLDAREDTLPAHLGGLILRAAIPEDQAAKLIIGGLPRSRLPVLLLLMAITAALSVLTLRQMARERALVRSREKFVASVSHELRTPLAQMQLYLDTLQMGRTSTQAERDWALSHIARETTRLTHLVENVLHVSKPLAAASVAAPVTDVSAEVAEAVESFRPLARSKRARLVASLGSDVMVAIRREHLRQIVLNLLDNAVKYGPTGQQVTVETRASAEHVEVTVSDEGPGISAADRERIWEPFFRGSSQEVAASGGTGIGLSIVRDLLRQYGGSIQLADAENGARFVVQLPRVRVAPRTDSTGQVAHSG